LTGILSFRFKQALNSIAPIGGAREAEKERRRGKEEEEEEEGSPSRCKELPFTVRS